MPIPPTLHALLMSLPLMILSAGASADALELRTAAQDSAPKYYLDDNGRMQGLCVDILHALTRTDPGLTFKGQDQFLPSGRIYRSLRDGALDLFCGSGKTPLRETQLHYLNPALYPVSHRLLARRDDPVVVNSLQDLAGLGEQGLTLTYLNSATHHFLAQQPGVVLGSGTDLTNLFERLLLGRARFIYYHDLGLYHHVRSRRLEDQVRFLPTRFRTYQHFLVVSRHTPFDTRARLLRALQQLHDSGQLKRIHQAYVVQDGLAF